VHRDSQIRIRLTKPITSQTRRTAFVAPLSRVVVAGLMVTLAGCAAAGAGLPKLQAQGFGQTTQHGYIVSPDALQQVPVGSSRDQVLIALGSPSTTANYGNDVFYYISQTRYRAAAFLPEKVVDQRVVAIYFDGKDRVGRIADYGLQDGKIFDFVSRTTPTAGVDQTFIQQLFKGTSGLAPKL
jgi:outer membrane protein assembly factor BamE (lipoprotein component of BamABCDE complex)